MTTQQNNRKPYTAPTIKKIKIDFQISLQLDSDHETGLPPGNPGWESQFDQWNYNIDDYRLSTPDFIQPLGNYEEMN